MLCVSVGNVCAVGAVCAVGSESAVRGLREYVNMMRAHGYMCAYVGACVLTCVLASVCMRMSFLVDIVVYSRDVVKLCRNGLYGYGLLL